MTQTLEREMTISHNEFFRILPKAVGTHRFRLEDNVITVSLSEGEIRIILSKERVRRIGGLVLPVTDMVFQIKNVAENTKKEFFKQFDRAFQRGGG